VASRKALAQRHHRGAEAPGGFPVGRHRRGAVLADAPLGRSLAQQIFLMQSGYLSHCIDMNWTEHLNLLVFTRPH
jgi:hypothetical protein